LKDINEYWRFLQTAPNIEKYVQFGDKAIGTGFLYHVLKQNEQNVTKTKKKTKKKLIILSACSMLDGAQ